jgi:Rieske Fe-S protein
MRPEGMYLGVDEPTRSVRSAMGDSVVILGGEGHKVGQDDDTTERYAILEGWAREHFDVEAVEQRWSAQDYASVDGLPYIGRQTNGSPISVATGFRKWGMTNGTAAGMMLARELTGQDNPWVKAFDASRQATTFTSKDFYRENANVAQQMVGDRLAAITAPSADSLQPGEGGIVSLDGDKVAAFRDEDGALHTVSAACTHLGCLVAFNTAERSWDCPCHGSRFSLEGEVLQGPATKDLERKPTS